MSAAHHVVSRNRRHAPNPPFVVNPSRQAGLLTRGALPSPAFPGRTPVAYERSAPLTVAGAVPEFHRLPFSPDESPGT